MTLLTPLQLAHANYDFWQEQARVLERERVAEHINGSVWRVVRLKPAHQLSIRRLQAAREEVMKFI